MKNLLTCSFLFKNVVLVLEQPFKQGNKKIPAYQSSVSSGVASFL